MSVVVKLQEEELDVLMQYAEASETTDFSLQGLLEKLRSQVDPDKCELTLNEEDLLKIQNYVSEINDGDTAESLLQLFERISDQKVES
jgi:hypothetical protein